MMNTTSSALKDIIVNLKGGTMVNLTTISTIKVAKKWGMENVQRVMKTSLQVGAYYENAVNNHLEKKGLERDFESGHLPWGRWETFNRIITHNDLYYGRFYFTKNSKPSVAYFINGRLATDAESAIIAKYDSTINGYSAKQAEHGLTDSQVIPYNPRLTDILSLSAEGIQYLNTDFVECKATEYATANR